MVRMRMSEPPEVLKRLPLEDQLALCEILRRALAAREITLSSSP